MQYDIVVKSLSKSYQSKGIIKNALSNVTLNIPQGKIFCIMGMYFKTLICWKV